MAQSGKLPESGPDGSFEPPDRKRPLSIPEDPGERLKYFRLDRLAQTLPTLPRGKGDMQFDPGRDDAKQYYLRAPVASLDDLKLWMGLPNDHVDHARNWQHLRPVAVPWVAEGKGEAPLRGVRQETVADAEYDVLHGFVDDVLLQHEFWREIVRGLLDRHRFIDILALDELIVEDGQRVTIANTPTAYFNRVTVYGSGSIVFKNSCKLIADTIEHV